MTTSISLPRIAAVPIASRLRAARPWVTRWTAATAAYVVAYLFLYVVRPAGDRGALVVSDFGEVPVEALAVLLSLLVVSRERRSRGRLAWSLAALALAANLIANVIYGAYDLAGQQPFPSIADAFYLAFYPLLFAGLLILPTASPRRDILEWRVWSNVAIVILGGGMALIHFVLMPTLQDLPEDPLAVVVSLAYPAADLALLAALATVATRRPYRVDRAAIAWFIVVVTVWFFADLAFALESASDTYVAGGPSDLLWLAGDVAFLLAAQAQSLSLPRSDATHPAPLVAVGRLGGYVMLALGLATLVAAALTTYTEIATLSMLAVSLTALVVVRQLLDEHDRRRAEAALLAEQADAARRSADQARRDPLTGLGNRIAFHEVLAAALDASRSGGHPVTLGFLDLDRFKAVNDHLGHSAGDRLLVEVGGRIAASTRERDTVVRLGGDEFGIILPEAASGAARAVAERIRSEVRRPVRIGAVEVTVDVAIGLVTYPESGAPTADALVHQADLAMYEAKRSRSGTTVWEAGFEGEADTEVATTGIVSPAAT